MNLEGGGQKIFDAKDDFEKEKLKGDDGDCRAIIEFSSKRKRASICI